jgi:hypothetical protein
VHRRELGSADSTSAFRRPPVLDRAASFATGDNGFKWLLQPDSISVVGVCAIALAAGASSILRAAQRPLWYDEIYTLVLSRLDTLPSIWSALQDAVDTNPPLYYLVTRVFSQLPLPAEVSYRIPSTLGFLVFFICLFLLARPIAGTTAGLIAALLPLTTPIYDPYAMEARPYALLCASLSLALLFWQRSSRLVFALLFACTISVAMSLHYYAVFSLGAFIAGEVITSLHHRSFRPQVWFGIFVGILPLLGFWPLIQAIRTYYAAGFWSKPQLDLIPQSYDSLLFLRSNLGAGFAFLLLLVLIIGISRTMRSDSRAFRTRIGNRMPSTANSVDPGLAGVLVVLLLSPVLMTVAAILVGAGMSDRYAMAPLVTAVAIGTGILTARMGPRIASFVLAMLLISFGVSTALSGIHWRESTIDTNVAQYQLPPSWLRLSKDRDLPIVVSDGVYYLTAYQYGSAEQRDRLMTIVDPPSALNYVNTDSVDRNLIALREYLAIRVDDFQDFAKGHPSFLLLSPHDSNGDYFDWWQRRLAYDGYTLRVEAILNRQVLYLVQR